MGNTRIEWADKVWNIASGCAKISEGCAHCYAERMAPRLKGRFGYPQDEPFGIALHLEKMEQPFLWTKPQMVFVCSMGDLFHEAVPVAFIKQVWGVMMNASRHRFVVLTKRAERMHDVVSDLFNAGVFADNVILGVSAENQKWADKRISILVQTPAAMRFVSCEPLLGSIKLQGWDGNLSRHYLDSDFEATEQRGSLDWVVCGGETGPDARPCHPDWVRSLRDQCQEAGKAFFFKSWGEYQFIGQVCEDKGSYLAIGDGFKRVGKQAAGRELDGCEYNQMPEVG